jgi:hypothetical protein
MNLHFRVLPVQQAHNEIDRAVTDAVERHPDLTYLELLAILNQVAASWIKIAIQEERKPTDAIQPGEGE